MSHIYCTSQTLTVFLMVSHNCASNDPVVISYLSAGGRQRWPSALRSMMTTGSADVLGKTSKTASADGHVVSHFAGVTSNIRVPICFRRTVENRFCPGWVLSQRGLVCTMSGWLYVRIDGKRTPDNPHHFLIKTEGKGYFLHFYFFSRKRRQHSGESPLEIWSNMCPEPNHNPGPNSNSNPVTTILTKWWTMVYWNTRSKSPVKIPSVKIPPDLFSNLSPSFMLP